MRAVLFAEMARTTQKTYSEKLRDPRWQKLRLEVMQRDDFACRHCNASEATLNVHHINYERGADPWEYEPDQLITLCEQCHSALEDKIKGVRTSLAYFPGVDACDISLVIGILSGDAQYNSHASDAIKAAATALWYSSGVSAATFDSADFRNDVMRYKCWALECASRFMACLATSIKEQEALADNIRARRGVGE